MPILKKKATEPTKSTPINFSIGDRVLLLDEDDNEVNGKITEIDKKTKIATIDCGENNYEEELSKLKPFKNGAREEKEDKSKGRASSLGSIFKKAKTAPDIKTGGFPPGNWEAIVVEGRTEQDKAGNTRGVLKLVGVSDDEVEGRIHTVGYTLLNKDGSEGAGMEYFKRDLVKLNIDVDTIEGDDDLENALEQIGKDEPWIDVTAKTQKDNPQYTNAYIDGMKDDQENKPETPAF